MDENRVMQKGSTMRHRAKSLEDGAVPLVSLDELLWQREQAKEGKSDADSV